MLEVYLHCRFHGKCCLKIIAKIICFTFLTFSERASGNSSIHIRFYLTFHLSCMSLPMAMLEHNYEQSECFQVLHIYVCQPFNKLKYARRKDFCRNLIFLPLLNLITSHLPLKRWLDLPHTHISSHYIGRLKAIAMQ